MILIANYEGRSGIQKAIEMLKDKKDGLESIVEGIKIVEADPENHAVGYNSWPNLIGEVELDASVMDGDSLRTGAVGALRGYLHPVEIAHEVMKRLDHEIIVGKGAARFAEEIGAVRIDDLTPEMKEKWWRVIRERLRAEQLEKFPDLNLLDLDLHPFDPETAFDTIVYLAQDHQGKIAAATSTSGWACKYPGRLGDSPIIGAGIYADSRYGACACTNTGEMTIRCSSARSVVLYMKMGMTVEEAVLEAVNDLKHLKDGFLGSVTIHAIDTRGNFKVVDFRGEKERKYLIWRDGMKEAEMVTAERIS